ncbi:putative mitochondrial-processing peptidase subunit beta [Dorcoceras hygrometricum]|uniref:Putative mitochondrial-processing peptidase subunit beta n=1 Tax=Dorcoceras hygrometricum TaxID=472368 RepID=A0A2Z7DGN8_9LAMI|nr:putative mitochondrial-processing peptidase subunit beta [Dorcoceras hygrometricum]
MLTGTLYPPPGAPPAGLKPHPAVNPGKPVQPEGNNTQPQRDLGVKPQYGEQQYSKQKVVDKYADAMQEIEQRAYTAKHIIYAHPVAVTKLKIRTLTSELYLAHADCHNGSPSNADPPPAKPIQEIAQGLQLRTTAVGSYDSTNANSTFLLPRKTLTSLKGRIFTYPNKLRSDAKFDAYANRLEKGDVSAILFQLLCCLRKGYETKRLSKRSPTLPISLSSELSTDGN